MQVLSVLYRKLHDGVTYEDFEKAWMPTSLPHYHGTVQAMNAVRIDDPTEVISLGIVHESWEDVLKDIERSGESDKERGEKISKIADSISTHVYHVKNVIDLGI